MSRRIRVLPDRIANQIAAGEVVERPASVVKELVENALDADASRIEISVRNGGKTEIRVSDDGVGMGREDALLAIDRHATSKIREEEDLMRIRTLGFRGEALPSIGAVSRLTVETAERGGDGWRIRVTGGTVTAAEACARGRGTTVTVRTLFYNVPARAKFLRSTAAETRAVSEVVQTVALAHPEVALHLESNGRVLVSAPPAGGLAGRLADLWSAEVAAEYIPVAHQDGDGTVTGLIQRPDAATPGGRRSHLFVNGRPFADRPAARAAERGYATTIPARVRPSVLLFLDLPPEQVDVNVHPAKAEVRFRDRSSVERLIEDAVRAALGRLDSSPSVGVPAAAPVKEAGVRGTVSPEAGEGTVRYAPEPSRAERVAEPPQMSMFLSGARDEAPRESGGSQPEGGPVEEDRMASMWQLHRTYILAETRSGLIIVDQHAAHERVLYEEMMAAVDRGVVEGQALLFPITLRLSPEEHQMVTDLAGVFARAGFEVEPFGGRAVIVHAVPDPHPYFDAEAVLREMIAELTHGSPLVDPVRNQHQRLCLSFACRAAIKAGQALSKGEMSELFDRLFATELPYHDIHGRPTLVQLSLDELHRRFRRGE